MHDPKRYKELCAEIVLEVKGQYGLLFPSCFLITVVQQPGTSSLPSLLKCSSESVIWMCRASFTSTSCSLPWSSTVVSTQWWFPTYMLHYSQFLCHPLQLQASWCSFCLVFSLHLHGLPNVDLGGHNCRGYDIPHWITYPEVMYP